MENLLPVLCIFISVCLLVIAPAIITAVILVCRKPDHPNELVDSDEPKKTFAFPVVVTEPMKDADPPAE